MIGNKIRLPVNFRFNHYKDIETRLEKFASRGLFLDTCGTFLWSFRKGEPKSLKYAVTYFSEGSMFNPGITDNQQTYFDYAKAAGWNIVTQFNQMQIFCSEADNPIPFETDEREKFENIKRCMKKSYLPSMIVLILVFLFNLAVQFSSYCTDPVGFLSDPGRLFAVVMILEVVFYEGLSLFSYFICCKRSAGSIAKGGACLENAGQVWRIIDIIFLFSVFCIFGWFLLYTASEGGWFSILASVAQIPIFMFVFWASVSYLKKKKAAARINRVISVIVLLLVSFAYLAMIVLLVSRFDFHGGEESDYRTVTWELSPVEKHDYRLYSHKLPLTCEALYGQTEYDYYSYEKNVDSTIFLTNSRYRQDSLPAKDSPPRLEYSILETPFGFVYRIVKTHLLAIPDWQLDSSFRAVDNEIFGTGEAYQKYYGENPTGGYVLFFEDKIITLDMEEAPTPDQIRVIREALQF